MLFFSKTNQTPTMFMRCNNRFGVECGNKWKMKLKMKIPNDIKKRDTNERSERNTNEQSTSNWTHKQIIYNCIIIGVMYSLSFSFGIDFFRCLYANDFASFVDCDVNLFAIRSILISISFCERGERDERTRRCLFVAWSNCQVIDYTTQSIDENNTIRGLNVVECKTREYMRTSKSLWRKRKKKQLLRF